MSTRKPRATRTKAETKAALNDVVTITRGKEAVSAKEQEVVDARNAQTRNAVADLSVEKALNGVTKTNLDVSKALSAVTEQLVETTRELETVKEAVALEQAELEQLHGKDIVASSIDDLIADYNDKKAKFDEDVAATRTAWIKEEEAHNQAVRERNEALTKTRQRDEAEYQYKTQQERRAAQDKFNDEMRAQQVTERDRREAVLRDHATRELELKARENDLASYKAQVEAFPAKLDAEVKKAEAIATNSVKREYEHKIQLMTKDSENAAKVSANELASLKQQLDKALTTIAEQQARLTAADDKVRSIAEKALEAASGRQALAEVANFASRENGTSTRKS